ncbi:MAG: hypothetical protein EOP48_16975 [Sphingobacteriales bacterium]|nr:MAG: hypothetical protein EOP48_16975 [Sphingobacteriales bacterium]
MKRILFGILTSALLTSCTENVYQLIQTSSKVPVKENKYLSNNQDVTLSYDFWQGNGQMTYNFHNNSEKPVYVDLNRSHLIINGLSMDYYQDREQNTTVSQGNSKTYYSRASTERAINNVNYSTKEKMKQIIEVPPHSYISIGGVNIVSTPIFYCELRNYNYKKNTSVSFTEQNTPINFRNFVTYSSSLDFSQTKTIDDQFWVEKIENMTETNFKTNRKKYKACSKSNAASYDLVEARSNGSYSYDLPFKSPKSFYIRTIKTR